jgi:site-specific DNA-adenine methylase
MSIPYLGSKRKSCNMIYRIINLREQKGTLVDLFCGGFAIGEVFLKNGWKVIANDKNKFVIALLDKTINKGLDENIVTQFVKREKFIDVIKNPNNYEDWFVGFIMCVWSFGNNQKGYMFGKNVEPIKKAGYELIFNSNETELLKFIKIPQKYIDGIKKQENWHKKRIALRTVCCNLKAKRIFKDMPSLECLQRLESLQSLQRLECLQSLQRLERMERLERLEIYSKDYKEIEIPSGAVVYADPPYKGTATYSEGNFNHDEFWEYCRKLSKTNHVYISEYHAPSDFISILSFNQKSTLQGGAQLHNNQPQEKLFIHKSKVEK